MKLKYWADMAAREGSLPEPVLYEADQSTESLNDAAEDTVEKAEENVESVVQSETIEQTEAAVKAETTEQTGTVEQTTPVENTETVTGAIPKEVKKSILPRPIAFIIRALFLIFSMIGISLLTVAVTVLSVALFVTFVVLIVGGIFAGVTAIRNISQAPLISVELLGMAFAVTALSLILMLVSLKCFSSILPKTAGLYGKAVLSAKSI